MAYDSSGAIADTTARIVYRDNLQKGILQYVEQYGKDLQTNVAFQEAFVRKIDDLCV